MCTSELGQIEVLSAFIQRKPRAWKAPKNKTLGKEISLWDAVKTKDWKAIAFNYNGPSYATYGYDTKLQAAYEAYKKKPLMIGIDVRASLFAMLVGIAGCTDSAPAHAGPDLIQRLEKVAPATTSAPSPQAPLSSKTG